MLNKYQVNSNFTKEDFEKKNFWQNQIIDIQNRTKNSAISRPLENVASEILNFAKFSKLKYGLKLWSTNHHLFAEAVERYNHQLFDFIELYVVPGSYDESALQILKDSGVEVNIHAPNEDKLDLSKDLATNFILFSEVFRFADFFKSKYIIIHLGTGNDTQILFHNLAKIKDSRIVIENVPFQPLFGGENLYGYNYARLKEVLDHFKFGFCLDFTHALESANSQKILHQIFLAQLMSLNPQIFHLSDGFLNQEKDCHLDLGQGEFDLKFHKSLILSQSRNLASYVVFETPKGKEGLSNDLKNRAYFQQI